MSLSKKGQAAGGDLTGNDGEGRGSPLPHLTRECLAPATATPTQVYSPSASRMYVRLSVIDCATFLSV
jgi:hypothetical protein